MRSILLLILLAILALSFDVEAGGLKLTDLSLEYKHSIGTNRHWSIREGEVKKGEFNILIRQDSKYVFVETNVLTKFTDKQFRYGALEGRAGLKYEGHELFIHHKSEHVLDYNFGKDYYNQNSVGVRIKID